MEKRRREGNRRTACYGPRGALVCWSCFPSALTYKRNPVFVVLPFPPFFKKVHLWLQVRWEATERQLLCMVLDAWLSGPCRCPAPDACRPWLGRAQPWCTATPSASASAAAVLYAASSGLFRRLCSPYSSFCSTAFFDFCCTVTNGARCRFP